jgi:hypothetical protein
MIATRIGRLCKRSAALRQFAPVTSAQLLQSRQSVRPKRFVVIDAVDRAQPFNAVDVLDPLVDQAVTLTMQVDDHLLRRHLAPAPRSTPSARRADTPSMSAAIVPHRLRPSLAAYCACLRSSVSFCMAAKMFANPIWCAIARRPASRAPACSISWTVRLGFCKISEPRQKWGLDSRFRAIVEYIARETGTKKGGPFVGLHVSWAR